MKHFLIAGLLFLGVIANAQLNNYSLQLNMAYNYHNFPANVSNQRAWGYGILGSKNVNKLKISTGIGLNYKCYNKNISDNLSGLSTIDYKVMYYYIPIQFSYLLIENEKFRNSVLLGFNFSNPHKLEMNYNYSDGISRNETVSDYNKNTGIFVSAGYHLQYKIIDNIHLGFSPKVYYTLIEVHGSDRPTDKKLPDDRIGFSLQLGIEYLF